MTWLIGCERSGQVRRAFRERGIPAISCDLFPADDGSNHHICDDIQVVIQRPEWTGAILFPDCTYLTVSGLHWNHRDLEREAKTVAAIEFVERLWAHRKRIGRMAIENPVGCLSTRSSLGGGKPVDPAERAWSGCQQAHLSLALQSSADQADEARPRQTCRVAEGVRQDG